MKNQNPFILCIIAGSILIALGFVGSLGSIVWLYPMIYANPTLSELTWLLDNLLQILLVVTQYGGVLIIIGGFLLTTSFVYAGKLFIGLIAILDLLSLIGEITESLTTFGVSGPLIWILNIPNFLWVIGIILTVIALWITKV